MSLMQFLRLAGARAACLLALVAAASVAPVAGAAPGGPTWLDPPRALGDHALTDHTGAPFSTADLHGRPAVLFFGFTHCPDVCPLTLARLSAARRALPAPEREAVRIVLVTVDPMRDTPARLTQFLEPFGPDVTGLTAPLGALAPLLRELGVSYAYTVPESKPAPTSSPAPTDPHAGHAEHAEHTGHAGHAHHAAPAYTVTHSEALYLLDAQARLTGVWTQPGDGAALSSVLGALARGERADASTSVRPAGPAR